MNIISTSYKNRPLIFLILATTLVGQFFFFTLFFLLGIEYNGISDSTLFATLVCVFAAMSCVICASIYGKINNVSIFLLLFSPLFFLLFYLVENPITLEAKKYFIFFYPLSFPSMCIGAFLAFNNCLKKISPWIFILMLIQSIVLILYVLRGLAGRDLDTQTYLNYQYISYLGGFSFSVNIFYLFMGRDMGLFNWQRRGYMKIICAFLLAVQFVSIFVSGGRGGFVVAFISLIVAMILKLKNYKSKYDIVLVVLLICLFLIGLKKITTNDNFNSSRVFSYITKGGIDMSETSGRDIVYSSAISLIRERPIFGYGFFKYYDLTLSYPHNMFLEFLLQRGVVLLILSIVLIFKLFHRFANMCRYEKSNYILLPFLIFCLVELQFSDTYYYSSFFWFCVSYVFCMPKKYIQSY